MTNASKLIEFLGAKVGIEPQNVNSKTKESKRFIDASQTMMCEVQDPELVAVLRGFKSGDKLPKMKMPKDAMRVQLSTEMVKEIVDLFAKMDYKAIDIYVAKNKPAKFEARHRMSFWLAPRIETEAAKAAAVSKEQEQADKDAKNSAAEENDSKVERK